MSNRRRALVVMATVAAALLPGVPAAQAALTWTAPGILTPKESDAEEPRVAIDAQGNALAVWNTIKPLPFDRVDIQVQGAQRRAGGNFQLLTEPSTTGRRRRASGSGSGHPVAEADGIDPGDEGAA